MELYRKIPEGGRRTDFGLLKKKYATALKPAADGPSEKRCEKPQHKEKIRYKSKARRAGALRPFVAYVALFFNLY